MTPKKTVKVIEEPKFDEPVIPEGAEIADVFTEPATPAPEPRRGLIAYAAFDIDGEHYEAGEEFTPRKTWKRNLDAEEFRTVERKKQTPAGMVFSVPGPILNKGKKDEEQTYLTVILPLKEA